jgi:hypothetical protein
MTTKISNKDDDNKPTLDNKERFAKIISQYLESNPILQDNHKKKELEIRFATNPKISRPITKIDYDNVIKQLYSYGFTTTDINGDQMLRITPEFVDKRTGQRKLSSFRAEIIGTNLIQEYCKSNSLQKLIDLPMNTFKQIKFTQKMDAVSKSGDIIRKLNMDDYNFRVSYQTEQDKSVNSNIARTIISNWNDSLKTFRCLNRIRFKHNEYPIYADLTIVKSSTKTKYNNVAIPKYTIQDAEVFENIESYEIELEIENSGVGAGTNYNSTDTIMAMLRKSIRIILCGLQGSNYPISIPERNSVLNSYMHVIYDNPDGPEYILPKQILPKHFTGPNSQTLQVKNIVLNQSSLNNPNIRTN